MKKKDKKVKSLEGALSKYANKNLLKKENNAWTLAVKEKQNS